MRRAFKFRLWTNANQERELETMLETHRRLYNVCLDYRQMAYDVYAATITYADCSCWFKHQRTSNPYFGRLNFSSAQATMRRLDKAFKAFFRRVAAGEQPGYPRFKGRDRFESIEFPAYGDGIRLNGERLRVQNVGVIRVKLHRPIEGKIKTVTLKREADKWYVVFSCDLGDIEVEPKTGPAVGIDVGLNSFLTTSCGEKEPDPEVSQGCVARTPPQAAEPGTQEEGRQQPPQGTQAGGDDARPRGEPASGASPPDRLETGPSLLGSSWSKA